MFYKRNSQQIQWLMRMGAGCALVHIPNGAIVFLKKRAMRLLQKMSLDEGDGDSLFSSPSCQNVH
jgi:hypothetical protein